MWCNLHLSAIVVAFDEKKERLRLLGLFLYMTHPMLLVVGMFLIYVYLSRGLCGVENPSGTWVRAVFCQNTEAGLSRSTGFFVY